MRFAPLLLLSVLLSGCTAGRFFIYNFADSNDHKRFPARELPASATPQPYAIAAERGPKTINMGKGDMAFDDHLAASRTTAFLIIHRDSIIYERYFKGYDEGTIHPSFSMAKSVIGMLVGCAIEDGFIRDVQQPVTDFVPEMKPKGWDAVTLEHVLQMTSGMDFSESYVNPFGTAAKFYYGRRLYKHTTKLGLAHKPGEHFAYMSGNSQLLGLIVERAMRAKGDQRSITQYLNDKLWQPLGMEHTGSWSIDRKKNGIEKTFCCLNAPARDFAKLGSLYLHGGNWNGQQLVPAEWVERSTHKVPGTGGAAFYQYQFWLPSAEGDYMMRGILGQYVYVDPARELVMVRLGSKVGNVNWSALFRSLAAQYPTTGQ